MLVIQNPYQINIRNTHTHTYTHLHPKKSYNMQMTGACYIIWIDVTIDSMCGMRFVFFFSLLDPLLFVNYKCDMYVEVYYAWMVYDDKEFLHFGLFSFYPHIYVTLSYLNFYTTISVEV